MIARCGALGLLALATTASAKDPIEIVGDTRGLIRLDVPDEVLDTPEETGIQRYRAILFGAQDYGSRSGIPDLSTPNRDVAELGRLLERRFGFEVEVVRNATRADIISRLDLVVAQASETDAILVYYAGHGIEVDEEGRAYWLPVDARESETSNWVSHDDVHAKIRSSKAKHVLLMADSCFAGRFRSLDRFSEAEAELQTYEAMRREVNRSSRLVITSGANEPVADSGRNGMSVFAYFMHEALGASKDRYVRPELLFQQVRPLVMKHSTQAPVISRLDNTFDQGGSLVMVNDDSCAFKAERSVLDLDAKARAAFDDIVGKLTKAEAEELQTWLNTWATPQSVAHCNEEELQVKVATDLADEVRGRLRKLGVGEDLEPLPRRSARGPLLAVGGVLTAAGGTAVIASNAWWGANNGDWNTGGDAVVAPDEDSANRFTNYRTVERVGWGVLAAGVVSLGLGASTFLTKTPDADGVAMTWTTRW